MHYPQPRPAPIEGRESNVSELSEALPLDGGGLGGGGPGTDAADSRIREDGLTPGPAGATVTIVRPIVDLIRCRQRVADAA